MRRFLLSLAVPLALLGMCLVLKAQPVGNFTQGSFATPPAYTGPGDIVSGALSFYSTFRAYDAAYATGSNNNMLLCKTACGTTQDVLILTTGFTDITTATGFCGGSCQVGALYNQLGTGTVNDLANNTTHVTDPDFAVNIFDSVYPAAQFNGSSQVLPRFAANVGPSGGYTACALINMTNNTGTYLIAAQDDSVSSNLYLQFFNLNAGVFHARINQDTGTNYIGRASNSSALSGATAHYTCMTWDGGTAASGIKLYIAGTAVDTTNDNAGTFTAPNANSIVLTLGAQGFPASAAYMPGYIMEFIEYSSAKTPTEIADLCANLPGGCV